MKWNWIRNCKVSIETVIFPVTNWVIHDKKNYVLELYRFYIYTYTYITYICRQSDYTIKLVKCTYYFIVLSFYRLNSKDSLSLQTSIYNSWLLTIVAIII